MPPKPQPIIVVGHRNPDNDAICSVVAYAYLKNELEKRNEHDNALRCTYVPARLGSMPPETAWVLERNGIEPPVIIDHVYTRIADIMTPDPISVGGRTTIMEAGGLLRQHDVRSLVVTNDDGTYKGLVTTRTIADRYIAATDLFDSTTEGIRAVAANLIESLEQCVDDVLETNVLVLNREAILREAAEDLMESALREAVVLDEAGAAIGIVTRSDVAAPPRRKVILLDHNEISQAAQGIEEAEVVEIIDHHRIADVTTANPIRFLNIPVGSSSTIVTMEFRQHDVEIPPGLAEVMLSAILTDTVILKSPTTTDVDREQVAYLSGIAGVDAMEFGLEVFRCRSGSATLSVEKLVCADSKEFSVGGGVALIAQHETVDLPSVLKREDEVREYMHGLVETHGYKFVLLMVTDIVAEGSQFFCEGNSRLVNRLFSVKADQPGGCWMPGILSRKKQVAARILGA